ncbi:hypothetical protein GGS20DRAFT_46329 [Poronia punctata]|nr:hypothetical protein GGS20DRAFT_46329 [Poronia punctata]
MQPQKPDKPGVPTSRKSSLGAMFSKSKKTFSFSSTNTTSSSNNNKNPHHSTPTPIPGEGEREREISDIGGYISPYYSRTQRTGTLTEEDLKNNTETLHKVLTDAWPKRNDSRYGNARALLVCWADHDDSSSSTTSKPPSSLSLSANKNKNTDLKIQGGGTTKTTMIPTLRGQKSSILPLRTSFANTTATATGTASDDVLLLPPPIPPRSIHRTSSRAEMRESSSKSKKKSGSNHGPFVTAASQLGDVLERRYGIKSQTWLVPSIGDPQEALAHKVRQFVADYGSSADSLVLFWYGGHAEFVSVGEGGGGTGTGTGGEVIWYGGRDEPGIPAKTASKILANARADVLMINDSPFANHIYVPHASGPGTFELLGSGSTTPSNLEPDHGKEGSLTRTLSLMLDSPFLAAHGVSVVELHRKLLDMQAFHLNSTTFEPIAGTSISTSPLDNSSGARHIPARARSLGHPPAYPIYCQISQSPSLERGTTRNIILSKLNTSLRPKTVGPGFLGTGASGKPVVRLDIQLERPFVNVRRWKEWILRAPDEAEGVRVSIPPKEKESSSFSFSSWTSSS